MHKTSKRPRASVAAVLGGSALALAVGAGIAWALYTATTDQLVNQLEVGDITVEVQEDYEDPGPLDAVDDFKKEVSVLNTGTGSAYVRVLVAFSDGEDQQSTSIPYNSDDWSGPDADGYWYYNQVVAPQESTSPLFDRVEVTSTPEGGWGSFDIFVYVEGVQSTDASTGLPFPSAQKAFESVEGKG